MYFLTYSVTILSAMAQNPIIYAKFRALPSIIVKKNLAVYNAFCMYIYLL